MEVCSTTVYLIGQLMALATGAGKITLLAGVPNHILSHVNIHMGTIICFNA